MLAGRSYEVVGEVGATVAAVLLAAVVGDAGDFRHEATER
jgi:hypothetical protein